MFADPGTNPFKRRLVLLTKSANVHYLRDLPTNNVVVTFSLNPEPIADMFEGHFPDGLRITPAIDERLGASRECERMGFATRWRVDPIIPVVHWQELYKEFFAQASKLSPQVITFGIYRKMGPALKNFARKWGLQPMDWDPPSPMVKDGGTHLQIPQPERIAIYRQIRQMVHEAWPVYSRPTIALCKEIRKVRQESGITSRHCNCE